jgi:RNA polymerase sigma-70 factor (ECF subfamily)
MTEELSFAELIRRVRAGDGTAAAALVQCYGPAIRRSVRLRLDPRLRRYCDSVDVCQGVLCSFFVRAASGQYELETPEQLLKLLVSMARHKLAKVRRHQHAARRDDRRVLPGDAGERQLAAAGPTPSREVAAKELLEQVHRQLSPGERRLVELRNQGRDWAAIAAEVGGSPEALRKQLARAVERVSAHLGVDDLSLA